jgi:hypothetical protein
METNDATCKDCLHLKCSPGWWKKAEAYCEMGLLDGKQTVRNAFAKGHRFMLDQAKRCHEFDDMRD